MPDDRENRQSHANGDAKSERVKDCCSKDYRHEAELGVAANLDEKEHVMRGFFDERPGYC
jgi:hypothetical protein